MIHADKKKPNRVAALDEPVAHLINALVTDERMKLTIKIIDLPQEAAVCRAAICRCRRSHRLPLSYDAGSKHRHDDRTCHHPPSPDLDTNLKKHRATKIVSINRCRQHWWSSYRLINSAAPFATATRIGQSETGSEICDPLQTMSHR